MSVVAPLALAVAVLNACAAIVGALRWRAGEPSRAFWALLRAGQVAAALFAAFCGVLALSGRRPDDGLFWLYALLPLAVGVVGEQLRLASAQIVLDQRGLEDAQSMSALPEAEQHAIVAQIVRREMGVLACTAAVVVFLALRAASTAKGF